jgi:protein required for attachment to host cells
MKPKWIVVANTNKAIIYSQDGVKHTMPLAVVTELSHPESKMRTQDLSSGPPGHYKTSGDSKGAYSQATDPHDHEIAVFAKEIATVLAKGLTAHDFDHITLVMPPHFYGLVEKELTVHVQRAVTQVVQKDYTQLPARELLNVLTENT